MLTTEDDGCEAIDGDQENAVKLNSAQQVEGDHRALGKQTAGTAIGQPKFPPPAPFGEVAKNIRIKQEENIGAARQNRQREERGTENLTMAQNRPDEQKMQGKSDEDESGRQNIEYQIHFHHPNRIRCKDSNWNANGNDLPIPFESAHQHIYCIQLP